MHLTVERILSGFLFWFIIITNLLSGRFGHETFSNLDSEAKLKKINIDPGRFKVGVVLAVIEHVGIISLAVVLFFAFGSLSLMLGIVWVVVRTAEGAIQIYYKKDYWGLLSVARKYSGAISAEKDELIELGRSILKAKNSAFIIAQILFSVGTLAYSILFAVYGGVPAAIGWFGIAAATIYGLGNGIALVKPGPIVVWNIGGLLVLLFEITLGGWLLVSPFF